MIIKAKESFLSKVELLCVCVWVESFWVSVYFMLVASYKKNTNVCIPFCAIRTLCNDDEMRASFLVWCWIVRIYILTYRNCTLNNAMQKVWVSMLCWLRSTRPAPRREIFHIFRVLEWRGLDSPLSWPLASILVVKEWVLHIFFIEKIKYFVYNTTLSLYLFFFYKYVYLPLFILDNTENNIHTLYYYHLYVRTHKNKI